MRNFDKIFFRIHKKGTPRHALGLFQKNGTAESASRRAQKCLLRQSVKTRKAPERRPGEPSTPFELSRMKHYIYNVSYPGGEGQVIEIRRGVFVHFDGEFHAPPPNWQMSRHVSGRYGALPMPPTLWRSCESSRIRQCSGCERVVTSCFVYEELTAKTPVDRPPAGVTEGRFFSPTSAYAPV